MRVHTKRLAAFSILYVDLLLTCQPRTFCLSITTQRIDPAEHQPAAGANQAISLRNTDQRGRRSHCGQGLGNLQTYQPRYQDSRQLHGMIERRNMITTHFELDLEEDDTEESREKRSLRAVRLA